MSYSTEALKQAIELEKQAIEKYKQAINSCSLEDAKETLKQMVETATQHLETAQWLIMAENSPSDVAAEEPKENGATKLAAGKCPFSGQFKEMGIDIENMDMSKFDMSKFKS